MKNLLKIFVVIIANCMLLIINCSAADRFWVAGSTADWNNTANWSTTSGGSGGASVPGSSDVAKFDGNGTGSCTINATVNVAGIDIGSGYSGTVSQGSYVMTVGSSHFTMAGGTFAGGSSKIDLNGKFALSGGAFTATSDTLFVANGSPTFSHSGGTFNHNNGAVVFDGSGGVIDVLSSTVFYDINISILYYLTMNTASGDTIKIVNNFYHKSGMLGGTWAFEGNLKVGSSASVNNLEAQLIFSGTANQTYEYSAGRTSRIKIDKPSGTVTPASGTTNFTVQGFRLENGSFTAPSGEFKIGGSNCTHVTFFEHNSGTFNHNNGTVVFDPSCYNNSVLIVNVLPTTVFNHVAAKHNNLETISVTSGDTLKITGNFNHNKGDLDGVWQVEGNLKVDGTANAGNKGKEGVIIFSGTANQTYEYSAGRTSRIKINKTSGTITAASGTVDLAAQGLILSSGDFTAPTGNLFIGGKVCTNTTVFDHTGGAFNPNEGTVVFDPSCYNNTNFSINVLSSTIFNHVAAKHNYLEALTVVSGDTLKMEGDFNHNKGDIDGIWQTEGNLKVDGNASAGNKSKEGLIIFSGTANQTYEYSVGTTSRIKINKTSGTITPKTGTTDFKTLGFDLVSGSFTAPSGEFHIGNKNCIYQTVFAHSGGTFNHNNGRVIFKPSCWSNPFTIDVIPATRFYDVTDNHQNGIQLNLATGDTLHVDNEMKFLGGLFNSGVIAVKGKVIATPGNGANIQLLFCGTADQDFDLTGYTNYYNGSIKINKPAGKVNLLSACTLDASSQTLTFVKGTIATTATNLLTLGDNVTVSGMSDSSHVEGPVKKTGNDAFTFPVGKNGHYRKIGMSAPAVTSDAFTAEYFEVNSNDTYSHSAKDGSIAELSRNEYWNLARTTGTSNVSVTLSIDSATSCSVDNLSNLKVAAWDGSTWKDKGNGGTSGNVYVGTVVSSGSSNTFGVYGVGTITGFSCWSEYDDSPQTIVTDTADYPLYMERSLIVRFASQYVNEENVDNLNIVRGDLNVFLNEEACDSLAALLPSALTEYKLIRIFRNLTTTDTISISRLGEEVRIPKFWTAFVMVIPETDSVESITALLDTAKPYVFYSHLNRVITLAGCDYTYVGANDYEYEYEAQLSLDPSAEFMNPEDFIGINIEPAWAVETGKFDVKVGVYDTGIERDHDDFLINETTNRVSEDGLSAYNGSPGTDWNVDGSSLSHGTKVAGIIAATRNNNSYIAGIAGGDYESEEGVSLYSFRIFGQPITSLNYAADAIVEGAISTGFGLNIMNHSWGYNAYDPINSQTQLLIDAVHTANLNKVIFVAARGNNEIGVNALHYPACYDDNWILNVSGTGEDGGYEENGSGGWIGYTGGNIDIAAPSFIDHITSLTREEGTSSFHKTSAATPHASGVAALMLSQVYESVTLNSATLGTDNLSPEDVEFLVQKTATDVRIENIYDEPGYDDYIGWGRLNAGKALQYLSEPGSNAEYMVRHYTGQNDIAYSPVNTSGLVNITLTEPVETDDGTQFFANEVYRANIYRYFTTPWHEADMGEQEYIVDLGAENHKGIWARHSSSNLYPPLNGNQLVPHERIEFSPELDQISGYFYEIFDEANNPIGWLPFEPSNYGDEITFAYSILVHNREFASCDSCALEENMTFVNGEEEWTEDHIMENSLVVESGGILTISGKVLFRKGLKLIVEPGGKVIVDGGMLTSACDDVWQGVEVWGNPNAPQGSYTSTTQGMIELKNGALIENARIGVNLSKGGDCCAYNGGILKAENSTFRNCRKSVQFMSYDNNYNSLSKFTDVVFLCDQPMIGDDYNGEGSNGFVSIWNERGIEFIDCAFVVDRDDSWDSNGIFHNFDDTQSGKGVAMIDGLATFIKSENGPGNRFINLTYGLQESRTLSSASPRRFVSTESTFDNCAHSVLIEGGINDEFTDNTFNIPASYYHTYSVNYTWGIYNWNSRYYTHSGNIFNNEGDAGLNWGVISRGNLWLTGQQNPFVSGTGGLIFDNTFNDIVVGDQTEQYNPFLRIRCNTYSDIGLDWLVNPGDYNLNTQGFLGMQGVNCDPSSPRADNYFCDGGNHIWTYAQYWKYWAPEEACGTPLFGININNSDEQTCDNRTRNCEPEGGGTIGDEKVLKAVLDVILLTLQNEYDSVFIHLDSNNTDTLLARIGRSSYSNATLTNDLLSNSLLSDEVLLATCGRSPFFSYNQFISIVNHNSPVSWEVWKEIEEVYYESPAPPDTIIQAQFNDTIRTLSAINRDLNVVAGDLFRTENNIIQFYAEADSMPDLIHYLIDTLGTKAYKKYAIGTCLEVDTAEWAREILEDLDLEEANDSAFYDFYDVAVSLKEDDKTWFEMDGGQKSKILDLSETGYDVFVQAQAVLRLVDDSAYIREPEQIPEEAGKWDGEEPNEQQQNQNTDNNTNSSVQIYPNPFNNSFDLEYSLAGEVQFLEIVIYDVVGRIVKTQQIRKTQQNKISVDLGECLGVYFVRIIADGNLTHKDKIICISR